MFNQLNYHQWCTDNKLPELFSIRFDEYGDITQKINKSLYETVDPGNVIPSPAQLDDLTRLHFLVRNRKVTTILEFGSGKSTVVLAHALRQNQEEFSEFVTKNIRRANPFEIHSVDTSQDWLENCQQHMPAELLAYVHFHRTDVEMATFNGRACTMFKQLPNICPDLIYLDGPDQFSVANDIHGISTATSDRVPMAADILLIEPFLLPGTLLIIDGRTANARFLKNNLQRNWEYQHHRVEDIHTFELVEPPLGKYNEKQIEFCLGDSAAKYRV